MFVKQEKLVEKIKAMLYLKQAEAWVDNNSPQNKYK